MNLLFFIVAALLLAGCTNVPEPVTRSLVTTSTAAAPAAAPRARMDFIYPADASNHLWEMQASPDLVHWSVVMRHMASSAGVTNLPLAPAQSAQFFRMKEEN